MKHTFIDIILVVVLLAFFGQTNRVHKLQRENQEYKSNVETLMTGLETLRDDSLMRASQINSMTLSIAEYEAYRAEDRETIESLRIKLKNVEATAKQKYEVHAEVETPIDTLYIPGPTKTDTVHQFSLTNEFISFSGQIDNNVIKADINVPITVFQVIHKVPKHKFLWWSWGCKGFKQVITTDNPYVNLKYAEFINLK